jgi:hypothetical protein
LARNDPKTEAEKITKYENVAVDIKNMWKVNRVSVYPLVISAGVVTKNFMKYLENVAFTKNVLSGAKGSIITFHTVRKFLGHAL